MLLFGVSDKNGNSSRVWRLVSVPGKPELYLVPVGLDRFMHASYHPGGKWHFKVGVNDEVHTATIVGADLVPGFAHLFTIVFARSSIYLSEAPAGAVWLDAPDDDRWTYVELVQEWTGANRNDSWPTKNSGSVLVGRLPVADGTTVAVIAHLEPPAPINLPFNFPDDEAAQRARAVDPKHLRAILLGTNDAGVMMAIDGASVSLPSTAVIPD